MFDSRKPASSFKVPKTALKRLRRLFRKVLCVLRVPFGSVELRIDISVPRY